MVNGKKKITLFTPSGHLKIVLSEGRASKKVSTLAINGRTNGSKREGIAIVLVIRAAKPTSRLDTRLETSGLVLSVLCAAESSFRLALLPPGLADTVT